MKVLLVTGSYPPDVCGTAEYTARLCDALQRSGVDAHIFYRSNWSLPRVPALLDELGRLRPDLVHMQYPTTGYGWHLGPQAIGLATPLVVTLHEASQSHVLRKLSLYPFLLNSRHFIFTNRYEQAAVTRWAPWIRNESTIIPIGCNILVSPPHTKLPNTVTCFSIIRPNKGLEDVIELARLLRANAITATLRIVGAVMPRWLSYYERLRSESKGLPIDWFVDRNDDELSRILSETSLAYLPFPDGASERRSSLIAMFMNQACVITPRGAHTPNEMYNCIVTASSPTEAAARVHQLLASPEPAATVAARGYAYSQRFDWDSIGLQHRGVYEKLLRQ
jgi:glycosyltransferase involved in cell wall biosynthesis